MATVRAAKGQTAKIPLTCQFSDGTGLAVDPDSAPSVQVFYSDPAGSLTLKATLTGAKQASLTGFYGAFLDLSDPVTYPAGDYVVRWSGDVDTIATAGIDFFEVDESPSLSAGTVVSGAYCTEAQVRDWGQPLESITAIPSAKMIQKIAYAAALLDAKLRVMYDVPFAGPPYDPTVVVLNIWLAAVLCIRDRQGQPGNKNELGDQWQADFDEWTADILSGVVKLTVPPRATSADGSYSSNSSTLDGDEPEPQTFGWSDPDSSLSRY